MMPTLIQAAADSSAAAPFISRDALAAWIGGDGVAALIRATIMVVAGLPLLVVGSRWIRQLVTRRYNPQRGMITAKLVLYPGLLVLLVSTMSELGFSLAPLLGAAGILGIALGFASQTSVSNIISGFFLIGEQPFVVDDVIQIGDTVGQVLSVDMLSVKLRTFDNKFVRIPNESIVKSQVTTLTRFPIRRIDILVGIAYKEDIEAAKKALLDVAAANPLALMEPEPQVMFEGFGDSSIDFKFVVWTTRENFLKLKNGIQAEIKAELDRRGIEVPFPHRTLYSGAVTEPFPVRIVER